MTEQTHVTRVCIHCKNAVETPYCPTCGQPNPPQSITLGQISADIQGRAYGTSGLFQRTLRDLFTKPGQVVATYIAGNRVMYSRPIGFFLLMITILLVLVDLLNFDYAAFLQASAPSDGTQDVAQTKLQKDVYQFVINHLRLMSFVVIPMQAFFARWLFFRKRGFTYLEHTVLPFYAGGQLNLLSVFTVLLFEATGLYFPFWLVTLVSVSYFAYIYVGWIQTQSKLKVLLKGIAIYVLSVFSISILAMIGGIIYLLMHPELMKAFSPQP